MKRSLTSLAMMIIGVAVISSCTKRSTFQAAESNFTGYKYTDGNYVRPTVKPSVNSVTELATAVPTEEAENVTASVTESQPVQAIKKTVQIPSEMALKTELKNAKNSVTRQDKREIKQLVRRVKRNPESSEALQMKERFKEQPAADDEIILLVLLAIFIPPLAVYLYEGAITTNFWIDLILTLLFWLPGVIYAFIVLFMG